MGEGRAEPRTAYAVLYAPSRSVAEARAQRGATERSEFYPTNSFLIIQALLKFFARSRLTVICRHA